jgi:hypothetical protein
VSRALCDFLDGKLEAWRGLPALAANAVPACVGVAQQAEWLGFRDRRLHYRRYARPSGDAVWVFDHDDAVVLVERFPAGEESIAPALTSLGAPDRVIEYGARQLLQRPLARDGETVDELVWGARGLALLRARSGRGDRLARARAFAPTTADDYDASFVALRPVEYREER